MVDESAQTNNYSGVIMKGIRFFPTKPNINFMRIHLLAFAFSLILGVAAVFFLVTKGLNFGVDFTGGTVIEIKTPQTPDLANLRNGLNELGLGSVSIQEFGEPDNLLIRLPQQAEETPEAQKESEKIAQAAVRAYIDKSFEGAVEYRRTEYVGPQVGDELKKQGLYAMIFAVLGIMAYVWMRFEWQFGVSAFIGLAHDALTTMGLFAITQMEFNLTTVAAILTVLGYSINDTVVVFDRIRENLRKYKKMPLPELFNAAINQTLSRTVMTAISTLLALVALYIFGGEVLRGFVIAMIFGIVLGTYSSIFVAAPILLYTGLKRGDVRQPKDQE